MNLCIKSGQAGCDGLYGDGHGGALRAIETDFARLGGQNQRHSILAVWRGLSGAIPGALLDTQRKTTDAD